MLLTRGGVLPPGSQNFIVYEDMMSEKNNRWVWLVLLAIAVTLHLLFLYRVPLSPGEAFQALASLDAAKGVSYSTWSNSALLHLGNTLLFSIFGAGQSHPQWI